MLSRKVVVETNCCKNSLLIHSFVTSNLVMANLYQLISLLLLIINVNCDVDQLVKHCNEDWCTSLDPSDPKYSSKEYNRKLIQFFSAGIPQLIYEDGSKIAVEADVSSSCSEALNKVSKSLLNGEEWAFKREYIYY